jgi:signal transduction histidine kinase
MIRPSIRLRLTAWYASIFLLAGCVLLAVSYEIVSRNTSSFPARVGAEMARLGTSPLRTATSGGGIGVNIPPGATRPLKPPRAYIARQAALRNQAERTVRAQMHRQILTDFALALLGTTLLSLVAGWFVAGRMLRPVSRITTTARRVAAGADLRARIAPEGPNDELRELAETFDQMLGRLDRAFASQRSFVANASHELRTPLAVLRAEIEDRLDDPAVGEAELRDMAAVVYEAVQRAEQLIDSLLTLARSQDGHREHRPVDLGETVAAVALRMRPAFTDDGTVLEVRGESAAIDGDAALLERLIENLLTNALRYNQSHGFVSIAIERDSASTRLVVANSGPAIAPEVVPRLFEPFVRADDSRSRDSGGAGLGLSIVAAVASAHGGEASARARPAGGLVVTVSFPTAPAPLRGIALQRTPATTHLGVATPRLVRVAAPRSVISCFSHPL